METNGKAAWSTGASVFSALAVLIAGGWVIIDLKVENAVLRATQNERAEIAGLKEAATVKDSLLAAKLIEVETQFRAEDQLRNVQWADARRTMALLWEKTYGQQYPTGIQFYPNIAQDVK